MDPSWVYIFHTNEIRSLGGDQLGDFFISNLASTNQLKIQVSKLHGAPEFFSHAEPPKNGSSGKRNGFF